MLELFSLILITMFVIFLVVLVCLNLKTMMNKGRSSKVSYTTINHEQDAKHIPNIVQEKWKDTIPSHKVRVGLRNKRKRKGT